MEEVKSPSCLLRCLVSFLPPRPFLIVASALLFPLGLCWWQGVVLSHLPVEQSLLMWCGYFEPGWRAELLNKLYMFGASEVTDAISAVIPSMSWCCLTHLLAEWIIEAWLLGTPTTNYPFLFHLSSFWRGYKHRQMLPFGLQGAALPWDIP